MAMKPKLIALNAALIASIGLIAWQARVKWEDARAERQASLNVPVRRVTPPPVTPAQKPPAVEAAKYADVAAKNLFSKDRNPTVIVEAPKVEPPKPMPPLPVVYGVITLPSGTKAVMSDHAGAASRSVTAGDSVGGFKILALDARKVTFEWDGKPVDRNIDDLVDHSGDVAGGGAPAGAGPAAPAAAAPPSAPATPPTAAALGADNGTAEAPSKACKSGENSPVGTVVDGYRKIGTASPFGVMGCSWVPAK
jgi:hypothetical protein